MNNELSIVNIEGVDCYEEGGVAYIRLEHAARGLGFTQEKDGVEYVRWETVNKYLADFGFPNKLGKDDFIPENVFYRLAMKAKNEVAEKFQAKVADEIIPAIRKTGSYSVSGTNIEKTLTPEAAVSMISAFTSASNITEKLFILGISRSFGANNSTLDTVESMLKDESNASRNASIKSSFPGLYAPTLEDEEYVPEEIYEALRNLIAVGKPKKMNGIEYLCIPANTVNAIMLDAGVPNPVFLEWAKKNGVIHTGKSGSKYINIVFPGENKAVNCLCVVKKKATEMM